MKQNLVMGFQLSRHSGCQSTEVIWQNLWRDSTGLHAFLQKSTADGLSNHARSRSIQTAYPAATNTAGLGPSNRLPIRPG